MKETECLQDTRFLVSTQVDADAPRLYEGNHTTPID